MTDSVAGAAARLELRFSVREGNSYLARQRGEAPLRVQRPFLLGGGRVLLQIVNVGPGPVGGDHYRQHLVLDPGSRVVLVDQAATKVHGSGARAARQEIDVTLGEGAELELYPGLVLPYPHADFRQRIRVQLAAGARFALLERFATGRLGRGERGRFARLSSELRLSIAGVLRYADRLELTPESLGTGVLDGGNYLASGVWVWGGSYPQLEEPFVSGVSSPGIAYLRGTSERGLHRTPMPAAIDRWRQEQGMALLERDRYGS